MRLKTTALPLACGLALLTAFGTVNAGRPQQAH